MPGNEISTNSIPSGTGASHDKQAPNPCPQQNHPASVEGSIDLNVDDPALSPGHTEPGNQPMEVGLAQDLSRTASAVHVNNHLELYQSDNHDKLSDVTIRHIDGSETREPSQLPEKLTRPRNKRNERRINFLRRLDECDRAQNFKRYYILKFPGVDINEEMNILELERDIIDKIGSPKKIEKISRNSLMIEVLSLEQATKLETLNSTKIAKEVSTVQPHRTLNTTRGVVRSKAMGHIAEDQLLDHLKNQGVISLKRLSIKRNGEQIPTDTYFLDFDRNKLPRTIDITSWHSEIVKEYIRKPTSCYNCLKFGHIGKYCRAKSKRCARCSNDGHDAKDCDLPVKCFHCDGEHMSTDRRCEKYVIEMEILATQGKEKTTYGSARDIVLNRMPEKRKLYSTATKQKNRIPQASEDERQQQNRLSNNERSIWPTYNPNETKTTRNRLETRRHTLQISTMRLNDDEEEDDELPNLHESEGNQNTINLAENQTLVLNKNKPSPKKRMSSSEMRKSPSGKRLTSDKSSSPRKDQKQQPTQPIPDNEDSRKTISSNPNRENREQAMKSFPPKEQKPKQQTGTSANQTSIPVLISRPSTSASRDHTAWNKNLTSSLVSAEAGKRKLAAINSLENILNYGSEDEITTPRRNSGGKAQKKKCADKTLSAKKGTLNFLARRKN